VIIALQPENNDFHALGSLAALACGFSAAIIMLILRKMGEDEPLINNIFFPASMILTAVTLINTFWLGWQPIALEHIVLFIIAAMFFL
ncbi:MAG: hypothetical protein AAF223_05920, partial [Bacteroidota bacterium]